MISESKIFNWVYSGIPDSKRPKLVEKHKKHYYQTPSGKIYPSITTMLHALMPSGSKASLQRWKYTVGHQVAEYITQESAKNGTATHQIIEKYLNNQIPANNSTFSHVTSFTPSFPLSSKKQSRSSTDYFRPPSLLSKGHLFQLKPLLHNIDNIRCTEIPLYSDSMRLAGTCDCIAEYNGKLSIIDFKTSRKQKKESWIENYFLQATAYSKMYEYLTNVKIDQIVILISGEDGSVSEFVKDVSQYCDILEQKLHEFENIRHRVEDASQ